MYILTAVLKATFRSFLESMNTKEETTSPKSHSTEMRAELIDLLNASMLAFGWTILKGAWRWVHNGYAGSPYKHIICRQSVAKALFWSFSKRPESLNIPTLCFLPSNNKITKIKSYRLITLFQNMGIFLLTSCRQRCWNLFVQTLTKFWNIQSLNLSYQKEHTKLNSWLHFTQVEHQSRSFWTIIITAYPRLYRHMRLSYLGAR